MGTSYLTLYVPTDSNHCCTILLYITTRPPHSVTTKCPAGDLALFSLLNILRSLRHWHWQPTTGFGTVSVSKVGWTWTPVNRRVRAAQTIRAAIMRARPFGPLRAGAGRRSYHAFSVSCSFGNHKTLVYGGIDEAYSAMPLSMNAG